MRLDIAVRVDERGEVWVQGADERLDGVALGGMCLAVLQKVEHDDVEGAGGGDIAGQGEMGHEGGGVLCELTGADIAGRRLLWRREVGVYGSRLAMVEQEVDAETLVRGQLGLQV